MNATEISRIMWEIAAKSKANDKKAILRENMDENLVWFLNAALNPYRNYGFQGSSLEKLGEIIKELEAEEPYHPVDLFDRQVSEGSFTKVDDLLEKLATRQVNPARSTDLHDIGAFMATLNDGSKEALFMILQKDLRAGLGVKTVNPCIPKKEDRIPVFECMLAHPMIDKHLNAMAKPYIVEPKLDGMRAVAFVYGNAGSVEIYTRTGRPIKVVEHIQQALIERLAGYGDFIVDGELTSGSFNKSMSDLRKADKQATDAVFNVFYFDDMESFAQNSPRRGSYEKMRERMNEYLGDSMEINKVPHYRCNSKEEILAVYNAIRADGGEGVVVKAPGLLYEKKRSRSWLKVKAEETLDLPVVGMYEGTGKYEDMMGGLIVLHNSIHVRVGGGFSDAEREEIWKSGVKSVEGRLIEVEYHEETPDGSLRHSRFVRFRDDKEDSDAMYS